MQGIVQALSGLSGPWGRPQAGSGPPSAPRGEHLLSIVEE